MATYLLDTNIVSELRKPRPHGAVLAWLEGVVDADLRLSAVTLGEIQSGIEVTREQDPSKAAEIEAWADQVAASYGVLPMDVAVFRLWAKLMHRQSNTVLEDAMIAATAQVHRLVVVTRNVRDFARFDVPVFNPFEGLTQALRLARPPAHAAAPASSATPAHRCWRGGGAGATRWRCFVWWRARPAPRAR